MVGPGVAHPTTGSSWTGRQLVRLGSVRLARASAWALEGLALKSQLARAHPEPCLVGDGTPGLAQAAHRVEGPQPDGMIVLSSVMGCGVVAAQQRYDLAGDCCEHLRVRPLEPSLLQWPRARWLLARFGRRVAEQPARQQPGLAATGQ